MCVHMHQLNYCDCFAHSQYVPNENDEYTLLWIHS